MFETPKALDLKRLAEDKAQYKWSQLKVIFFFSPITNANHPEWK